VWTNIGPHGSTRAFHSLKICIFVPSTAAGTQGRNAPFCTNQRLSAPSASNEHNPLLESIAQKVRKVNDFRENIYYKKNVMFLKVA
jgi:hypothetical protein